LVFAGTPAVAEDWPQWLGLHRDARVSGFAAPKAWPKELAQKWKVTVGDGVATPALVGDRLYVFGRQDGEEVTRCLDAATGRELWKDRYAAQPATGAAAGFAGPRSSPAVADGKVVTLGVRGTLSCFEAESGRLLWRKDDFPGWPRFFVSSSPLVLDSLCIAQLGGPDNGGIAAYELAGGELRWKWTGDGPAYASPVPLTVGDRKLVVAQTEKKMVALTATDGRLVWEEPFAPARQAYNAATPIVDGQTVIYTGGGRGVRAVRLEAEDGGFRARELWHNRAKSVQFNTPVIKDGLLFGLSQENELFCLDAKSGDTLWTAPVARAGAGQAGGERRGGRGGGRDGYGSIVDAGAVLLALTPSSELRVFAPDREAYRELARIKVADTPTYAYPVLAGNRLFVKDKDALALRVIE
jgi:outer membrane protein assembly factor BamB